MVQLWVVVGLAIAAVAVSTLGALLSIIGLGKLFSGAVVIVCITAGALELAKFVTAAYLHQTWKSLNFLFRSYLVACVATLSLITSMGIFGFLSDAYLASSSTLEAETVKLDRLHNERDRNTQEMARITASVDEIPDQRITKKLKARADVEPMIRELKAKNDSIEIQIEQAKLKVIEVKEKVGPLIYISKAFNMNIDDVVKYLILVFVAVFDPLAICLVIAFSDALIRRSGRKPEEEEQASSEEGEATLKMRFVDEPTAEEATSVKEVG